MEHKLKNIIRKSIFSLLREESLEPPQEETEPSQKKPTPAKKDSSVSTAGTISTKGAFGSGGRSKKFVADAGARASKDPKGLLKDLGITKEVSGSDLEQALKIINSAIHVNPLMSKAYAGAKVASETVKGDETPKSLVAIKIAELDRKNGVRFLAHTLTAAVNAGYVNLRGGLQFGQSAKSDIVIFTM
jgi:hypothetical protein